MNYNDYSSTGGASGAQELINRGVEATKRYDYRTAYDCFSKAASMGHPHAIYLLGKMYFSGHYVRQDYNQAFRLLKKAYDMGHMSATFGLAACYKDGLGTQKNIPLALKYMTEAVNQGNVDAMLMLGRSYVYGDPDLPANPQEGFRLFSMAALSNNADALFETGRCYSNAIGVKQDMYTANSYFKRAAAMGNARAQSYLAISYLHGEGIEQNEAEGIRLLKQAARNGDRGAVDLLRKRGIYDY